MTTAPDEGAPETTPEADAAQATSAAPLSLRPYQADAIERMRDHARRGHRAICLVLPTGGGKTVVATSIVLSHLSRTMPDGKRPHVLFVAHRTELISQAARTMRDAGVERVRTINAGRAGGDANPQVTVASVQTLAGVKWRDNLPDATMIVFDECHHVKAATWANLANRYKNSVRVGLTATPERADGSPLGDIFTAIVEVASTRQLIDLGFLAPCDVYAPREQDKALAEDPVSAYAQWGDGRRCVVFVPTVPYARALADQFTNAGIPASAVDGTMNAAARDATLATFREGRTRVIVNAQLLTEGWDDPGVDVCILTRNPEHSGTYLQMVGRVLRIDRTRPDKRATLIDLRGTTIRHGLPDDDREWSLDGEPIKLGPKVEACKQCKQCGYVGHPWRGPCPRCDFVEVVKAKSLDIDGRGVELVTSNRGEGESKAAYERRMRACYDGYVAEARARGYKLGWAWHKYKLKFPNGPNFRRPKGDETRGPTVEFNCACDACGHRSVELAGGGRTSWTCAGCGKKHPIGARNQTPDRYDAPEQWRCGTCRATYDDSTRARWSHASAATECETCMLDSWMPNHTEAAQ